MCTILPGRIQLHLSCKQEWGIFIARAQYFQKNLTYLSLIDRNL